MANFPLSLVQRNHQTELTDPTKRNQYPTYMKTRLILVAFVLTGVALAATPSKPVIPDEDVLFHSKVVDDFSLHVQLVNLQKETTLIRLSSLEGNTLFADRITRHNGYVQRLDLERIPEGKYLLRVKQGDFEITQVIVKKYNQLLLSKAKESR